MVITEAHYYCQLHTTFYPPLCCQSKLNVQRKLLGIISVDLEATSQILIIYSALTFILLMWRIGRAPNSIPIYSYIQQDAMLHSLSISGNCSTCSGWYFHPSSGAHTTVSTASGIFHTVTAICRYRGTV
jgi:hypothetical protein